MKTGQEDARLSPVLWSFMELQHYSIWRNMLCALPVADEMVNPGRFNPHTGSKSCNMVGNVLPVTRWLILSSAYKSWQSMMVSHRAVDQLHSWDCCMRYHDGLSGLICRALSQPKSYKETFSFRDLILNTKMAPNQVISHEVKLLKCVGLVNQLL